MSTPLSVFLTGASGFIARRLADRFAADGALVRGTDLVADPGRGVVAGDVGEPGAWQDAAAGCDVVVHTAALVTNTASPALAWQVNVAGTRHALDAAVRAGASRFVHFSSVRAFSDVDFPDGVDESWPVRPDGKTYVDTKIASEQVALQAHAAGEVEVTVVRPGDVYGPGSVWVGWPVSRIAEDAFFLPDDGAGVFSPVWVDDVVDGVVLAATAPAAAGQVLTLSGGVGVTNLEFFGHFFRLLGREPRFLPADELRAHYDAIAQADLAAGARPRVNADAVDYLERTGTYSIAKARRLLGWEPQVDLAEGMRRTEQWLRDTAQLPSGPSRRVR